MHSTMLPIAILLVVPQALAAPATPPDTTTADRPTRIVPRAGQAVTVHATPLIGSGEQISNIQVDGKQYSVLLDSGSTDFWIKGQGSGPSFSDRYGSGSAQGNIATGTLQIGGLSLTNQFYGLASSSSGYDLFDGIIGVRPDLKQFQGTQDSFIANIKGSLPEAVFAADFSVDQATFIFGDASSVSQASGAATFPIDPSQDGWFIDASSFNVGQSGDTSAPCQIDTGTTSIVVPQAVAAAYWAQVQGATSADNQQYTFPCDQASTLPNFVITLGGQKMTVSGKNTAFPTPNGNTCTGRLEGSSPSECILGQNFLYDHLVAFDVAKSSITIAAKSK